MVRTWNGLGAAQGPNGELASAIESLNEALALGERLRELHDDSHGWLKAFGDDLASVWMNLGVAHKLLGELPAAMESFGEAVALQERLRELYDDGDDWLKTFGRYLAATWENLGNAQQHNGDLPAAIESHGKALPLHERLRNLYRDSDEWLRIHGTSLAIIWLNLGSAQVDQGEQASAIESLNEALALGERLRELHDDSDDWLKTFGDVLAYVRMNLGAALKLLGELPAAMESFGEALALP